MIVNLWKRWGAAWLPIFFDEKSIKTPLLIFSSDNINSKEFGSEGVAPDGARKTPFLLHSLDNKNSKELGSQGVAPEGACKETPFLLHSSDNKKSKELGSEGVANPPQLQIHQSCPSVPPELRKALQMLILDAGGLQIHLSCSQIYNI